MTLINSSPSMADGRSVDQHWPTRRFYAASTVWVTQPDHPSNQELRLKPHSLSGWWATTVQEYNERLCSVLSRTRNWKGLSSQDAYLKWLFFHFFPGFLFNHNSLSNVREFRSHHQNIYIQTYCIYAFIFNIFSLLVHTINCLSILLIVNYIPC